MKNLKVMQKNPTLFDTLETTESTTSENKTKIEKPDFSSISPECGEPVIIINTNTRKAKCKILRQDTNIAYNKYMNQAGEYIKNNSISSIPEKSVVYIDSSCNIPRFKMRQYLKDEKKCKIIRDPNKADIVIYNDSIVLIDDIFTSVRAAQNRSNPIDLKWPSIALLSNFLTENENLIGKILVFLSDLQSSKLQTSDEKLKSFTTTYSDAKKQLKDLLSMRERIPDDVKILLDSERYGDVPNTHRKFLIVTSLYDLLSDYLKRYILSFNKITSQETYNRYGITFLDIYSFYHVLYSMLHSYNEMRYTFGKIANNQIIITDLEYDKINISPLQVMKSPLMLKYPHDKNMYNKSYITGSTWQRGDILLVSEKGKALENFHNNLDKCISESEFKLLLEKESLIIDKEMADQIDLLLKSNDLDNTTMALEMISNSNHIASRVWICILIYRNVDRFTTASNYNHVNFTSVRQAIFNENITSSTLETHFRLRYFNDDFDDILRFFVNLCDLMDSEENPLTDNEIAILHEHILIETINSRYIANFPENSHEKNIAFMDGNNLVYSVGLNYYHRRQKSSKVSLPSKKLKQGESGIIHISIPISAIQVKREKLTPRGIPE